MLLDLVAKIFSIISDVKNIDTHTLKIKIVLINPINPAEKAAAPAPAPKAAAPAPAPYFRPAYPVQKPAPSVRKYTFRTIPDPEPATEAPAAAYYYY